MCPKKMKEIHVSLFLWYHFTNLPIYLLWVFKLDRVALLLRL